MRGLSALEDNQVWVGSERLAVDCFWAATARLYTWSDIKFALSEARLYAVLGDAAHHLLVKNQNTLLYLHVHCHCLTNRA